VFEIFFLLLVCNIAHILNAKLIFVCVVYIYYDVYRYAKMQVFEAKIMKYIVEWENVEIVEVRSNTDRNIFA